LVEILQQASKVLLVEEIKPYTDMVSDIKEEAKKN